MRTTAKQISPQTAAVFIHIDGLLRAGQQPLQNFLIFINFFLLTALRRVSTLAAMCPGYALYIHRFAPFSARAAATTAAEIANLIAGRTSALIAAIFFALVLAAHAQESVGEAALPAWSEPSLPTAEATSSAESAPVPSAPEPLPSTPVEPLPSSSAALQSSEEAFPSSADPWSSSRNYTTAQTSVISEPVAGGPYGGFSTKNVAVGEGPPSGEPRRFYYGLLFTVRGVWDDNIFLDHTGKTSDYYFAIEPQLTPGVGDIQGR